MKSSCSRWTGVLNFAAVSVAILTFFANIRTCIQALAASTNDEIPDGLIDKICDELLTEHYVDGMSLIFIVVAVDFSFQVKSNVGLQAIVAMLVKSLPKIAKTVQFSSLMCMTPIKCTNSALNR